jgi:hypothetical protein
MEFDSAHYLADFNRSNDAATVQSNYTPGGVIEHPDRVFHGRQE